VKRYATIVADPPWSYEGFAVGGGGHMIGGKPRPLELCGPIGKKALPYRSMPLAQIQQLPVAELAGLDARLFLWATMRYLPAALGLLPGWGFEYRQTVVWDKTPHIPPFGGSIAPNAAEFLIVATKGKPKRSAPVGRERLIVRNRTCS
jgi:N6-adenosine-specific RNA methylase IME4